MFLFDFDVHLFTLIFFFLTFMFLFDFDFLLFTFIFFFLTIMFVFDCDVLFQSLSISANVSKVVK